MPAPIPEWRTYYAGQPALCPGVKLGAAERRRLRDRREGDRELDDRRDGPPAPELLTRCQAVFVRVGLGWIYRIRWMADRWHRLPSGLMVSTSMCRDCQTIFEVQADRVAADKAS